MRHLFHSLIILLPLFSNAQPTKDEILAGLTEIKSIDILDDNFTGYEVLSQKIGDARIVLLGEQTHGHGTTFTAKNKIIKYLVEKNGFDVVAFESGFFELNKIWDSDLGLTEKIDKVKSEIYPLWTASEELNPFFDFVKSTNENGKRLDLTGFDCKHDMTYGQKYYSSDFNSFLTNNKLPIVESLDYVKFKPILDNLIKLKLNFNEDAKSKPKPEELKLFNRVLDSIQSQLTRLPKTPESELWRQELNSLKMQARNTWIASNLKGVARLAVRDSAMAENLIWLANNKYKNRKIIVWAASYHIAKEKQELTFKGVDTKSVEIMGSMINLRLPNQVFSLGFVSPEGNYGEWYRQKFMTYPINRTANSIEKIISSLCLYDYAFIDFKKTSNKDKFLMAGISYGESKAVWNRVFDGLFYIKVMSPPTYSIK
jgi:erythromycin esterase